MPLRTVQRRLTGSQDINRLTVSVRDGASMDAVKEQVALAACASAATSARTRRTISA